MKSPLIWLWMATFCLGAYHRAFAQDGDLERLRELRDASQFNHIEVVKKLLDEGVDPNGDLGDYRGKPFFEAIREGSLEMVLLFIQAGADLKTDPLAIEVAAGTSLERVQYLMQHGARPNFETLAAAVRAYQIPTMEFFIKEGISPLAPTKKGGNLFHEACRGYFYGSQGDPKSQEIGKVLDRLLALGLDPKAKNQKGRTPLHEAMESSNEPAFNWLSHHGANMDAQDDLGITPLMILVEEVFGDVYWTDILIQKHANLDLLDHDHKSALDHAKSKNNWPSVARLMTAGARVRDPEAELTEIIRFCETEYIPQIYLRGMVKCLLPQLKEPASFQVSGRSLLVWAVLMNDLELLKQFIAGGCPVNAVDEMGRTALIWAGMLGAEAAYKELCEKGAVETAEDKTGLSAAAWLERSVRKWDKLEPGNHDDIVPMGNPVLANDLFAAIAADHIDQVRDIVLVRHETLKQMRGGILPVHLAAALGRVEMLQFFDECDPSLLMEQTRDETSVLGIAMAAGQSDVVSWWLKNGAKRHDPMILGEAAKEAIQGSHSRMLALLLDAGWRPDSSDFADVVGLAVECNDLDLLKRLIPLGIPQELYSSSLSSDPFNGDHRESILIVAARHQEPPAMLSLLLATQAKEAPDLDLSREIEEAAWEAMKFELPDNLEVLLKVGVINVNAVNSEGLTLLKDATRRGNQEVITLLKKHGAH